jgi:hypothetical protein
MSAKRISLSKGNLEIFAAAVYIPKWNPNGNGQENLWKMMT